MPSADGADQVLTPLMIVFYFFIIFFTLRLQLFTRTKFSDFSYMLI